MKALLLLSVLSLATAATAQPVDSRIPPDEFANGEQEDTREVRLIGVRYADCVVKKQAAAASAYVLTYGSEVDPKTRRRLAEKVTDGTCLMDAARSFGGVQMRFPANTLRYTLADALFRAQPPSQPLVIPPTLPELAHSSYNQAEYLAAMAKDPQSRRAQELALQRSQAIAAIFLSSFGECVVRATPAGAHALLRSSVLSPEENRAFVALRPAFAQCLDAGQNLTMNKAILRGTIALNHYRLAQALRQGQ